MSDELATIKQRADAEGDEAEREDADDEAETEVEAEAEQAPEQAPMSDKELAALGKKIDAENDRHEKRLRELYGAMFSDYLPCPLCMTEGHLLPIPVEARDPAQVHAVHTALGEHEAPELRESDELRECDKCDGYGIVLTHSKRDEHATVNCSHCAGRGYREVAAELPTYIPPAPPLPYANGANGYAPVSGELDAWNRPAGHPHFGRDPVYMT